MSRLDDIRERYGAIATSTAPLGGGDGTLAGSNDRTLVDIGYLLNLVDKRGAALEEIAHLDYRGYPHESARIARKALYDGRDSQ